MLSHSLWGVWVRARSTWYYERARGGGGVHTVCVYPDWS